jgi:pimeloyl-ACP methyl ester carboxylesterase
MQGAGALLAYSAAASISGAIAHAGKGNDAQSAPIGRNEIVEYGKDTLPSGIRSRYVDNNNGVRMHVIEAGFEQPARPCVVFLHGFPELAYTWRNQLLPVAKAGFHAIAPDLRGYGRSVATPVNFDDDLLPYSLLNRVSDVLGLVRAIGYKKVGAVVGHDWGAPTAAWCALVRPDVFESVVLMSTPFDGSPALPLNTANSRRSVKPEFDIERALAALPRPRKHYRQYLAARGANDDMWHAPQGVHDLLRAQFYFKSAGWKGNKPFRLKSWTAMELAKMPEYYIMDLDKTVAETMAAKMPSKREIAACGWMTEGDLQVYSTEYVRTGFQGGLNSYRILEDSRYDSELKS